MAYKKSLKGDLFCPNVTGGITTQLAQLAADADGAFYQGYGTTSYVNGRWESSPPNHVLFSASQSSATYTDDGHVYPLSCALNFIIKC